MSKPLILAYYNQLDRAVQFSKSRNEDTIKSYFWMLLNDYAHKHNYEVVRELFTMGTRGSKVKPDGILKTLWGIEMGFWESKDEKDDIEEEISVKQKKGYPFTNILFEDSKTAVLFQRNEEVMRVDMRKPDELDKILKQFVSYKNETVYKFEDAIEKFKADIPHIVEVLRFQIEEQGKNNEKFIAAQNSFLQLCQAEINPDFSKKDIAEMMIQHILTSDIFNKIFDDPDFHRHNTIAAELEKIIEVLFTYSQRKNLLAGIEHYYETINATAAGINDHHEKQKFLKVLYENFYKVYNPKAADKLGVVYTPNEIVQFMINSTDYLLHKHFGKALADKDVDILDPAAGTGTFICDIIEHIPAQYLAHKYKHELHCNELAILPYYISNLNVEYTFKQKMGYYEEFVNSCFVDTLDNTAALAYAGKQQSMFKVSSENAERIKRQNNKKISVVIGNPPYNANQQNENDNNKNREYKDVDKRIKDTYIKYSTAQKTKVYDMYARFYRWAMDRVDKNGVIAFITNRSFIDSRTFDGFRKIVQDEFAHCYIIDTKSDVRANPKIAGTTHNVFGIQTGVAVMFLIKKENNNDGCRIEYATMEDDWRKEIKLEWFRVNEFRDIAFEKINPDKNNNWISIAENDWDSLIPIADKNVKRGKGQEAIFKLNSLGIVTNRDEWCYDYNEDTLKQKVAFFCKTYEEEKMRWNKSQKEIPINDFVNRKIKWTEELEAHLKKGSVLNFNPERIRLVNYRPFTQKFSYVDKIISHRIYQNENIWGINELSDNKAIILTIHPQVDLSFFASNILVDQGFGSRASIILPLYSYSISGQQLDNITDWGLQQFTTHYEKEIMAAVKAAGKKGQIVDARGITKQDIFHYVYAVLHHPAYRKKYELNLKREFPRIPFYNNFFQWTDWGKALMDLHINYETAAPYKLLLHQYDSKKETKKTKELFSKVEEPQALYGYQPKVKTKLKADKATGIIEIDELTTLSGIPAQAWEYKLGNRSALEWVLDQYKEKKPGDATIAEKFNTYRFADYKEHVIGLLKKVCTVSVETMKIIKAMPG